MFAIIKTGGKQYKVAANDVIMVEKLAGASGDLIEFPDVLMMGQGDSVKVGTPLLANATVRGTVLDQIRDDKIIIFKKTRRHNYRRKNGHRQYLTVVRITDILAEMGASKAKATPEKTEINATAPIKSANVVTEKKAKAPVKKVLAPTEEKATAPVKKATVKSKKQTENLGD